MGLGGETRAGSMLREAGSSGYQTDSKERAMDLAGLIVFASKLFIAAGAAAAITAR